MEYVTEALFLLVVVLVTTFWGWTKKSIIGLEKDMVQVKAQVKAVSDRCSERREYTQALIDRVDGMVEGINDIKVSLVRVETTLKEREDG